MPAHREDRGRTGSGWGVYVEAGLLGLGMVAMAVSAGAWLWRALGTGL